MTNEEYHAIMAKYPELEGEVIRRCRERDAKRIDLFPLNIVVGYDTKEHPDPWGEQYGPYAVTCHPSILRAVGGKAVLVVLHDLKIMLTVIHGSTDIKTVGDLQEKAKKIWPTAHPMEMKEWNDLVKHENLYVALNDMKKMFPVFDLPDIRETAHFVDSTDPACTEICRIDRKSNVIQRIPIADMGKENFVLCVTSV